jgi:DNA-binding NarL/FixJ family response regulator
MSTAVDVHLTSQEAADVPRDEPVRVVIADVDGMARSMMHTAMRNAGGIAIVATTGSAREMLELVRYYQPTVLIVETALLSDRDVTLISSVRAASPGTCVLTISVDDDQTALEALRAGAVGHLSKDIDPIKLASLVARAADGEAIVPRRLVKPLLARLPEPPDAHWRPLHSRLTTREWEIIALLDEGASTQDIAEHLVVSASTVKSHVKSLLRKLDVHSRRDAVVAAHRLRRIEAMGDKAPPFGPGSSPASPTGNGNVSEQRDTSAAAEPGLRIAAKRAGDWR